MTSVPGANLVGKTGGLLGTYDDNTANDLTLANGTVLPADSSPQTIYYTFGESCECLFVCIDSNNIALRLLWQLSTQQHLAFLGTSCQNTRKHASLLSLIV
jgi:hypothetical protein